MEHKILLENVERLIKAKKTSADKVSKNARAPDAVRNLRRRVKGETTTSWNLDTLAAIAEELGVSPWELLRPPGAVSQDADFREMVREMVDEQINARRPKRAG